MENEVVSMELSMKNEGTNEVTVQGKPSFKDTNKAIVEGRLIHKHETEKVTLLTVMTMTGWDRNQPSAISITVPTELKEQVADIKERDYVSIAGVYRTVARINRETNERTYVYNIRAKSIKKAQSELESLTGLEGGRTFGVAQNKIILIGDIFRVTQTRRGSMQIILETQNPDTGKRVLAETRLYARNMKRLAPTLIVGNHVCIIGEIQTKVIEKEDGNKEYIHNLVVNDIQEV